MIIHYCIIKIHSLNIKVSNDMSKKTAKIFENIGKLIPGYSGYLDKEKARDTDYKLRLFVKRKLENFIDKIEKIKLRTEDSKFMKLDAAQNNLKLFCIKISNQKYGYKALFDNEESLDKNLDQMFENDQRFIEIIESLNDSDVDYLSVENLYERLDAILTDRQDIIN